MMFGQPQDPPLNVLGDGIPVRLDKETMGDFDSAPTLLLSRNPIHPLLPEGRDYEISPEVIALVKQNQFQGLTKENPLEHIDAFEEICGTISADGAPKDYLKCKLFSFTLKGKAIRWVKSLPAQSITTWKEYKGAFLGHFFTKQRANLLREKISSFQQGPVEPFHEALERFRDYTRECPNHCFSEGNLWNIFYRGIDRKCRFSLDTASNGNFMTKTVMEAKTLIENLASSDSDNFIGHEKAVKAINSNPSREEYNEMRAIMVTILRNQENAVSNREGCMTYNIDRQRCLGDFAPEFQEEVNFVGIRDQHFRREHRDSQVWNDEPLESEYQQKIQNGERYQQYGYRPQNVRQGAYGRSSMESRDNLDPMISELLDSHRKHLNEVEEKLDFICRDMNEKFDLIAAATKSLDFKIAEIAGTVKREMGVLPGRVEINPRGENVAAITLRNGKEYEPPAYPEEELTPARKDKPLEYVIIGDGEEPPKEVRVRTEPGIQEQDIDPPVIPKVYEPKLPYRNVLNQPKKEKEQAKLKDLVSQLTVRLPFVDACHIIPSLKKYMKAILTSNVSLEEGAMMITKECSAILQNRMPEKLDDPGSFVLACEIGGTLFDRALCDLGSSVNLMPYSVAKLLGITNFKPTKISLVFADRSVRRPIGVVLDVTIVVRG